VSLATAISPDAGSCLLISWSALAHCQYLRTIVSGDDPTVTPQRFDVVGECFLDKGYRVLAPILNLSFLNSVSLQTTLNFIILVGGFVYVIAKCGSGRSQRKSDAETDDADAIAPKVQDEFISAFVRARKPAKASPCCDSTCCNT